MSDEIRRLSEELARDPQSLAFIPLGELLRRQGQLDIALKVTMRGLERHSHNAEAHDVLARIYVDRGELQKAFDEWDMVCRLDPEHAGARKGMGFISFREGRLEEAEGFLAQALAAEPGDPAIASALTHVRQRLRAPRGSPDDVPEPVPELEAERIPDEPEAQEPAYEPPPIPARRDSGPVHGIFNARALFAELIGDGEQTALMLDKDGLVLAGAYVSADGSDIAQDVGAELSGVSDEARRAMRHLGMGDWTQIFFETEHAIVAMAPMPEDGLLLVAGERSTPLGYVKRLLERSADLGRRWLARLA